MTYSHPKHSILRTPSQTHCSFSGSCHGSLSSRRVTFAADLTSPSPTASRRRPSPPSTVPPPIAVAAASVAKQQPHPTPQVVVHKHKHHHHHGPHHKCKKHAVVHGHEKAGEHHHHPHRRRREETVLPERVQMDAHARKKRIQTSGVKKKRTTAEQRRREVVQVSKRRKVLAGEAKGNGEARPSKVRNNAARKDKDRTQQRSESKPLKETSSRDSQTQVLAGTVDGESSGKRSRRESKDGSRDRRDGEKRREAEKRRESREGDKRRDSQRDDDKRKPKRSSAGVNDLKRARRAVAKRLQFGRDDLSYSLLEPVDAYVLYELYKRVKGHGDEEDGNLKARLQEQENKEGRTRASRKQKDALAKWVGAELKNDVEQMRQLPRRVLVDRFVVAAAIARMDRLKERKLSGGHC